MISTERLILRQWQESDKLPFAKMNADPIVRKFFPSTLTQKESNSLVNTCHQLIEEKSWGFWAVTTKDHEFIGMIGIENVLFSAPFIPAIEIGWRIAPAHWGKGYATEGALVCLKFAFLNLGLKEIVAFAVTNNVQSIRVMKKLGMHHDPAGEFDNPNFTSDHKMQKHVLY